MADISIIIPHRGHPGLLWATIHSIEEDLQDTNIDYNYVIVTNGEKLDIDAKNLLFYTGQGGRLLKHLHFDEPLTPPAARQRGVEVADGKLLCFFDNHCLVTRRYFERILANFEARPIDMLHSAFRFYQAQGTHYHYHLRLDYNFWAESVMFPVKEHKAYSIAACGHGGFVVPKAVWDEVGGYGPEDLLQGYGGEEILFDLKMWRYGKNNWIDPRLVHYHYAGHRGYSRHCTDEYYVNLMVSANVIGGEKWLYRVYESFAGKNKHLRIGKAPANMYELMERAYERSKDYAKHVEANSKMSLDELLVYFREQQIAY